MAREIWRKSLSLPMGMLSITVLLGKQSLILFSVFGFPFSVKKVKIVNIYSYNLSRLKANLVFKMRPDRPAAGGEARE
jgi:hypothetical protein